MQVAHGYAKASGKPMVAILHNLVGLLHANMAIYYAYIDRAPVFIVGATGPMDETKRRPRIDWIHTAQGQGEAVRQYTKWDYQPHTIDGVPEAFARAYGVMMTQPQGPVYMIYDAWLQEQKLEHEVHCPRRRRQGALAPGAGSRRARASRRHDRRGRAPGDHRRVHRPRPRGLPRPGGAGRGGWRPGVRHQQPAELPEPPSAQREPLEGCISATPTSILCLDARDWEKPTTELASTTRELASVVPASAKWIEIGFGDLELSSWALDYQRMNHADLRVMADTTLAIPMLTQLLKARLAKDAKLRARVKARTAASHREDEGAPEEMGSAGEGGPGRLPHHAPAPGLEVWTAIRGEDWVLTAGTLEEWTRKLWNFDRPYRHAGRSLGTATQFGISLGVALAHRDAKRLVVGHAARRRPHVRRGCPVGRGQAPHPDAGRHVQQPRLLQRLGAPDPHGEVARHAGGARAHRHGHDGPGPGLRGARASRWAGTARGRSTIRRRSPRR